MSVGMLHLGHVRQFVDLVIFATSRAAIHRLDCRPGERCGVRAASGGVEWGRKMDAYRNLLASYWLYRAGAGQGGAYCV